MGRRKKGKDIHGWLLVDKPAGVTSSSVVNKLRYLWDAKKAGHGGTLDPDATGLLPVAFGEATKLLPYLEDAEKTYEFCVNWGSETTTDDASGKQIEARIARPTHAQILDVLPKFTGLIEQVPPQVSAVKVDGERAYDLAREGVKMDLKARSLMVEELTLLKSTDDQAWFKMRCGKGGYVRSIARDLGREMGCLGHVDHLRRIGCLGFEVHTAKSFDMLQNPQSVADFVPIEDTPLFDIVEVTEAQVIDIRQGRELTQKFDGFEDGDIVMALCKKLPIAIMEVTMFGAEVKRGLLVDKTTI